MLGFVIVPKGHAGGQKKAERGYRVGGRGANTKTMSLKGIETGPFIIWV